MLLDLCTGTCLESEMANSWNKARDLQTALAEVNELSAGGNNDARAIQNQAAHTDIGNSASSSTSSSSGRVYLHLKSIGESMAINR